MKPLKILFSEGSSLTAREFLSVLGPAGHVIEIADPNPLGICRFSRWSKRVHPTPPPGLDPIGYIEAINTLLSENQFDVLLPTHEQAWLFAVGRALLDPQAPVAIASADAFARVESKIEFARLLDEVNLPQPKWGLANTVDELKRWKPPVFLKAPFSTAGQGVRPVKTQEDGDSAFAALRATGYDGPLMVQTAAEGEYAQIQGLFDHGRLIAAHTSAQTAVGPGPSAAGRVCVDHPFARNDIAALGEHLHWHGGITLDYMFQWGEYNYIECNPRSVEPANAVASGVDIPGLQLRLSLGESLDPVPPGREGVRTHSSVGILLGTALYKRSRRAVLAEALRLFFHRGRYQESRERLTPVGEDFQSIVPLLIVLKRSLFNLANIEVVTSSAVDAYSMTPESIARVEEAAGS